MYLKEQLIESHYEWKEYIDRWKFLIKSYMGGHEFKEGAYLSSYIFESAEQYETRLDNTPYDNHVKAVCAIYNSFLFRQPPKRMFGTLENDVTLSAFFDDADLEGRSFDSVMRDVSTYSSIYGHCYVILDKPATIAHTRAEELNQGIRPYVSIVTPENVLDWKYSRGLNGAYYLSYLKIYEGTSQGVDVFRVYTPETISVYEMSRDEDPKMTQEIINPLGVIPAVCVYSQRSPERGIGISDVGDVADMGKAIYNELSELEQLIRISNHPSLVKTSQTQASAGAGSIIQMPDDLPEGLKPFLLEPNGSGISGILESINKKVESIDRMSYMGGIRSIESRRLSGVALATEFQLLNARLAEKADNLEHAEEQIWRIYALWQGTVWNGMIKYPDSFNIQDKYNDMNMLKLAKDAGIENPILTQEVEDQMLMILVSEERYNEIKAKPSLDMIVHAPIQGTTDLVSHLRDMVTAGYTNEQILDLHPELEALFQGVNNAQQP
tara:strand:- start:5920 stop:7404 length:1485 start_codon:yes stop_codon:yes gene_type:complete